MSIFRLMAGGAVQPSFTSLKLCSGKSDAVGLLQPVFDLHCLGARAPGGFFHLSQADAREGGMIHIGGTGSSSAMFEMTRCAALNVRVKCGWLSLKKGSIIGMTDDAFACLNAFDRGVAGRAIVFERRVRL